MLQGLKSSVSRKSIILLAGACLLAGCGGGDGDETIFAGVDPDGPLSSFNLSILTDSWRAAWSNAETNAANALAGSARYTSQTGSWANLASLTGGVTRSTNAITSSGVQFAHATGLTGAGQIVAVIDAGFRRTHEALSGAIVLGSPSIEVDGHGTAVAAIIAGYSPSFTGIAPGAQVYIEDFYFYADMAAATLWALNNDAVAQNNSWGPQECVSGCSGSNPVLAELLATNAGLSEFQSQGAGTYLNAVEDYAAEGVVVFAVSNDETMTQIDLMAGLPLLAGYTGLEAGWLAVANGFPVFDGSGNITNVYMISSDCLQAARWCITANGQWEHVPTDVSNSSYDRNLGSSFAAPQVAGAMALLAEAFPSLTPHELRVRLLASADNDFFHDPAIYAGTVYEVELVDGFLHEYSTVYGHGFLNIGAALLPIGDALATLADGTKIDTRSAWMGTGSAMGDAVQASLKGVDVAVTDSLGAGFGLGADKLFAAAAPASLAAKALPRAIGTDLTALRTLPLSTLTDVFAGQDGRTLDFADPFGEISATLLVPDDGSDNLGISLTRSIEDGGFRLDLGLKVARDDGSFIGFGDIGNGGGGTGLAALRLGLSQEFAGGGFFALSGEVGRADLDTPGGFTRVAGAGFNALGLELGQRDLFSGGDRLSLSVNLPMAVTSGTAALSLPSFGDGMTRSVSFEDVAIDLSPDARQIDYALTYQVPLGDGQELMLKAMHSENYGNIEGLSDQAVVAAFKLSF